MNVVTKKASVLLLSVFAISLRASESPEICQEVETRESVRATLTLSPGAFSGRKDAAEWLVVDTRSESAFAEIRIEGSIRLAPGQLKHAGILEGRKVLLVGEGYRDFLLEREAPKLRAKEVRILDGGIAAWRSRSLPLKGAVAGAKRFFRVRAEDVWSDAVQGGWRLVEVYDGKRVGPGSGSFDGRLPVSGLRKELPILLSRKPQAVGTLLVADSPDIEKRLVAALGESAPEKVFVLEGGRTALDAKGKLPEAGRVSQSSRACGRRK